MNLIDKFKTINQPKFPTQKQLKTNLNGDKTVKDFWFNVIETKDNPLPTKDTMERWNNFFNAYLKSDKVVLAIRKGNERSPRSLMENTPDDILRRGFLTKTDSDFDFFYTDNGFATMFEKAVIDNDISNLNPKDLLTYLQTPESVVRFHQCCETERAKAFYGIKGPGPTTISESGYTLAHIFDTCDHFYDDSLGFNDIGLEEALDTFNVSKGRYSDYTKHSLNGTEVFYRDNYPIMDAANVKKLLVAHFLRFLNPLNYFLCPKDKNGRSKKVYCEFHDTIKNRVFNNISGYEPLIHFAYQRFKEKYGKVYDDFLKLIMLPTNPEDFFSKTKSLKCENDKINIIYGNPLRNYNTGATSKTPKTTTSRSPRQRYDADTRLYVAYWFLTHNDSLIKIETNVLKLPTNHHGATAKSILDAFNIPNVKKGVLIKTNIDDEISKSTGKYLDVLKQMKSKFGL